MFIPFTSKISKAFFYPLWDAYDRSQKLREMRSLERAQWNPWDVKKTIQLERLKEITTYAKKYCSYYGDKSFVDFDSFEQFRNWPLLSKNNIRVHQQELLSKEYAIEDLVKAKTGGSTGVSLELFFDVRTQEYRNAAQLRSDRWAGWKLGETVGALWGNPPRAETFKEKVRSVCLDRMIFLDTAVMSDAAMGEFMDKVERYRIPVLFGHAHSLFILAQYVDLRNVPIPPIRSIISTSMMLLPHERKFVERIFQCPVFDRYGCEEVGLIASECPARNGLHINVDHVYVEILNDEDEPVNPEEEGNIVVTDLINRGMPLIRYKVGDRGVPSTRTCSCGRGAPLLEKLTGRTADFLIREDGTLVAGVSLVERTLTVISGISQMQLIQETMGSLRVKIVPDSLYTPQSEEKIRSELRRAMGTSVEIVIEKSQSLEQSHNGKYRFAICRVDTRYQHGVV